MAFMQLQPQGRQGGAARQKKQGMRAQPPHQGLMPKGAAGPMQVNKRIIAAAEVGDLHGFLSVIDQHLSQMNLVNLSTSIHRLAKFADKDPEVHLALVQSPTFEALQKTIHLMLINSKDKSGLHQCLSNITWSFAHLHVVDMQLLGLLAYHAVGSMSGFKPFELSTLLWAFAKLGVADAMPSDVASLFRAASQRLKENLAGFTFRSLATVAWAFATAKQRDTTLFAGLAREMCSLVRSANCQEIGNTIWAFATAGHRDRKLHHALAQAALPLMDGFKAQEISNMLWGFATNGYWHEEVFVNSIAAVTRMDLGSQHLANILWACAKVMPKALAMTYVIYFTPLCTSRLGTFKPQEVSSTVQAIAKVALVEEDEVPALGPRPLHEDVVELLSAMAQWVAGSAHLFTSSSFAAAVTSLVMLGAHADRPVDLIVEPAVVFRAGALAAAEKLSLLKAFWGTKRMARRAISVLAAGLLCNLDTLQSRDSQALARLCATARLNEKSPCSGSPRDGEEEASPEEVRRWCLALAADIWAPGVEEQPLEPEADADAEADAEVLLDIIESSSDTVSCQDPGRFGSEFGVQTAESLPYLEWQPKDLEEHASVGEQPVKFQYQDSVDASALTFNGVIQTYWIIE